MFFLISGAAASGKTTVARTLHAQQPRVICHDADELPAADMQARCHNLEEWIQQALAAQTKGSDFLLTSHSPLGEFLACPSAPQLAGIAASLIDCADTVRIERIRARGIDPRWPPVQDTFNWASWHRLHAYDPAWEPHVIEYENPFVENCSRWKSWKRGDPRWQVPAIDTTSFTVADTIQAVQSWIAAIRAQPARLTPESGWWIRDIDVR